MAKLFNYILLLCALIITVSYTYGQPVPEYLYYNFNQTGTSVPNLASSPPTGTTTATIVGAQSQGGSGMCGGALIGSGGSSSSDYVNTGWATNISGSWTISFWTSNIPPSATLFYVFGDASAGSFRCFTNGVAGANNWMLRGTGITDVLVSNAAIMSPTLTTFVYDAPAGVIRAYLNGTLVNTVSQGAITLSGTGPFTVGAQGSSTGLPSGGLMDEFRFYNRALSVAEVQQLSSTGGSATLNVSSCSSYTSPSGNYIWSVSGTYLDTVQAGSCDSFYTVNLTILPGSTFSTVNDSTCNSSYTLNGQTYTSSGTYMQTLTNSAGCDSIITLNLLVKGTQSSITDIGCGSYTLNGQTYTSSGTYTQLLTNSAGCDSTITLDLTISNHTFSTFGAIVCQSYTINGQTYTASGTYMQVIPNSEGCDSTITINLTIKNASSSSLTQSACGSYTLNGQTYTASGTYTQHLFNSVGCDSAITLNLTIGSTGSTTLNISACDSYFFNGQTYTISGTYVDSLTSANGCDSVVILNLTINSINSGVTQNGNTLSANATGATYQWLDCGNGNAPLAGQTGQSFTPAVTGNYAVAVTGNGCTDTSACTNVVIVAVTEVFDSQLRVYPNPAKDILYLDFANLSQQTQEANIRISNILGKLIEERNISLTGPAIFNFDISTYPAGNYLISISSNSGKKTTLRFVKSR